VPTFLTERGFALFDGRSFTPGLSSSLLAVRSAGLPGHPRPARDPPEQWFERRSRPWPGTTTRPHGGPGHGPWRPRLVHQEPSVPEAASAGALCSRRRAYLAPAATATVPARWSRSRLRSGHRSSPASGAVHTLTAARGGLPYRAFHSRRWRWSTPLLRIACRRRSRR